ncbi:MAG: type I restriction enzyme HsdR N-terminal domain-containing protein [Candidatus Shikimatogenerans bostrichidophilus]|nr:MAG: type I restriction enzyme HsdR N-terminal domain-containing protein [Candidatus Shikimatogenerans bostrichidophilus]
MKKIFCIKRKKFYNFSYEELLRQKIILFLIFKKKYNLKNILIEKSIKIKKKKFRIDIIVLSKNKPYIIIECKSPKKKINKKNIKQLLIYGNLIKTKYFFLTNKINNIIFYKYKNNFTFINQLPSLKKYFFSYKK